MSRSDTCEECGGQLFWGGTSPTPHSDRHHALRRKLLLKGIARRLREEATFREKAREAGRFGMVYIQWRITCLLGERRDMWGGAFAGHMWDWMGEDDRRRLIAMLGRDLLDEIDRTLGIRPSLAYVKYRIFDERQGTTL